MGVKMLSEFQIDLETALGNIGLDSPELTRHINAAYNDICGSVEFEALRQDQTVATVNGVVSVLLADGTIHPLLVRNVTSDAQLEWIPLTEFHRRRTVSGIPTEWTRHEDTILLRPTPNGVFNLLIVARMEATPFDPDDSVQTSEIPNAWDHAIQLLANHYGLLARGEGARSAVWLERAIIYIQSKITESDIHKSTPGLEQSFVANLQARLAAMQAQAAG